jgi:hypothetical protein
VKGARAVCLVYLAVLALGIGYCLALGWLGR